MEMTSAEILNWITRYGYIGILVLLMIGIVGFAIPDEVVLTCAGFLVSKGYLAPEPTVASAFIGSMCGISLSYLFGRVLGLPIIHKYGHLAHITPESIDRMNIWYQRFGKWLLLFGYFIAGVRHLTAFTAGTTRLRLPVFALFAYTGAFLWSVTFISFGYFLGDHWTIVSKHLNAEIWLAAAVIAGLAILFFVRQRKSAPR
jgi:membrane protein DedA with SNARE-associated domain